MKVGLYLRVSTQEQAKEGYSIGEQESRLKKFCEAMRWDIYKVYTDAGYSGGNTDRPDLKDLMQDVKDGKMDKVLVYKLDRLSRSQLDTLFLIEKVFLANDTDFVSMSENFDTGTPFGRAMIGILAVFAQLEREQIKERMTLGKEGRAKEGKWHGGSTVPVGYNYVPADDMLYIDEYEKMQILEVYDLFLKGTTLRKMEQIFLEKGYKHKHGKWDAKCMRRVLSNPLYCGYIRWEGNVYKGVHERIVDEDTFNQAKKLVDERAEAWHSSHRRTGYYTTYLGGMVRCSCCGAGYHIVIDRKDKNGVPRKKYGCYSRSKKSRKMIIDPNCKNKYWKVEELHELVFNEIRTLAMEPDTIKEMIGERQSDVPEKISVLQKEIEKRKKQKSRYMDLYSLEEITMDEVQEKTAPLNEEIRKLEAEIESLQEGVARLSEADTAKIVSTFEDILKRGNLNEVRLVLETLIEYIEIDHEDVIIHWNFV